MIRSRHALRVEALEDRSLPSILSGTATVNTTPIKPLDAHSVKTANATSSNGIKVVVWMHNGGATDWDIYGQMYTGDKRRRGEFKIASSPAIEEDPSVGIDKAGNFVVAWTTIVAKGNDNVMAARFSANGKLLGRFTVCGTRDLETSPSVAVAEDGTTLIAYTRRIGTNDNVYAQTYTASGKPAGALKVAATALPEGHPGASAGGGSQPVFSIAYQTAGDIALRRYSAAGKLRDHATVSEMPYSELYPRSAMDDAGDTVVTWEGRSNGQRNVWARTIDAAGKAGTPISVAAGSTTYGEESQYIINDTDPAVAMDRATGNFVVAYNLQTENDFNESSYHADTAVQELALDGKFLATASAGTVAWSRDYNNANKWAVDAGGFPAVSIGRGSNYIVTFESFGRDYDTGSPQVIKVRGRIS